MNQSGNGAEKFAHYIMNLHEDRVFEVRLSDKTEAARVKDQLRLLGCSVDGPDNRHWLVVVKPF